VTIWVVREGDGLYVRSWRGLSGAWYRGAHERAITVTSGPALRSRTAARNVS
jgi:hypothetical protein